MSDINSFLKKILSAVYGEEVRGSIHDALSAINTQCSVNWDEVCKLAHGMGNKQDRSVSVIDLSGSEYNQDTYYPVTGTRIPKGGLHKIRVYSTFESGGHPSWATNASGYSCNMEIYDKAQTWGQADGATICTDYSWKHTGQSPCGYLQMTHSSIPVVILRGGGVYYIETDYAEGWTVRTDVYTHDGDTVRPGTKRTLKFDRATIFANINGNVTGNLTGNVTGNLTGNVNGNLTGNVNGAAASANKWTTGRYIEGMLVDGTADRNRFGICSTDEETAAKTCTIPGISVVYGARVNVQFTKANSAENPTLSINGDTAKPIYWKGIPIPAEYIYAGAIMELLYAPLNNVYAWHVVGYFEPSVYHATCTNLASSPTKNVEIPTFRMMPGACIIVKFQNGNAAQDLKLKISFNGGATTPKAIYYNGAPIPPGYITPNSTIPLLYDGENWVVVGELVQYQLNVLNGETPWWEGLEPFDASCVIYEYSKFEQYGTGMYKVVSDPTLQQQIVAIPNMHESGTYVIEYESVNVEGFHFVAFATKSDDGTTTAYHIMSGGSISTEQSDGVCKYIITVEANELPRDTYFVFITALGNDKFAIHKRKY